MVRLTSMICEFHLGIGFILWMVIVWGSTIYELMIIGEFVLNGIMEMHMMSRLPIITKLAVWEDDHE